MIKKSKIKEIKKILIIRLSALGDSIHTLPALYALRKKFPYAQIDWVIEDKSAKFAVNNPLLDNVYVIKRKKCGFMEFAKLIIKIRKQHYDAALDFQQLFKSGIILGLSGAERRITLDGGRELSGIFANETVKTGKKLFDINYHAVKRNLDLTSYLGCSTEEIKFVLPDLSQEYTAEVKNIIDNLDKTKKTIAVSPATTWVNKHWTIEGWQETIKAFQKSCNIVITGDKSAEKLVQEILNGIDSSNKANIINLTGRTSLADLVYIYRHADTAVSPDSGSAHTAWAAGAKSILTLFFASSALRTAPFCRNYFYMQAEIGCSPCMSKKCRLKNSRNICCRFLKSEKVIDKIKSILSEDN